MDKNFNPLKEQGPGFRVPVIDHESHSTRRDSTTLRSNALRTLKLGNIRRDKRRVWDKAHPHAREDRLKEPT
jgi:hypothetical protein